MALRNRLDDHNAPLRRSKWHFAKSRANARTVLDLSRPWSTGEVLALLSRRGTPDRTVYWRRAHRQATSEPSRLHRRQARPPSLAAPFPRELFSTAVRLKFKTTGEKFGSSGEQTMTAHIMRFSGCALILATCVGAVFGKAPVKKEPKPQVEVVFCLDTTGSMGGLIDAAKQKIWGSPTKSPAASRHRDSRSAWSPTAIAAINTSRGSSI